MVDDVTDVTGLAAAVPQPLAGRAGEQRLLQRKLPIASAYRVKGEHVYAAQITVEAWAQCPVGSLAHWLPGRPSFLVWCVWCWFPGRRWTEPPAFARLP